MDWLTQMNEALDYIESHLTDEIDLDEIGLSLIHIFRTVSLRAEEDGVGVYTRLGFKACFNRVIAFYNRKSI